MIAVNLKNAIPVQVDRHHFSDFIARCIFHKIYCANDTADNYK